MAKRKRKSQTSTKRRNSDNVSSAKLQRWLVIITVVLVVILSFVCYIRNSQSRKDALADLLYSMTENEVPKYGELIRPDYEVYGIDLSRYQTDINWDSLSVNYNPVNDKSVKKQTWFKKDISFIFIKATQGRRVDRTYDEKRGEAKKRNYLCGAYHVFEPDTFVYAQAENFIEKAKLDTKDLPPVLDIENNKIGYPLDEYRKNVLKWLTIVESRLGVKPIIYVSDHCKRNVFNTPEFNKYQFWLARFFNDPPLSSDDWVFWQYTKTGYVHGLKGDVDISVFNGSKEELIDWSEAQWQAQQTDSESDQTASGE